MSSSGDIYMKIIGWFGSIYFLYYVTLQRFIVNYKDFYKEVIACIVQQPINIVKTMALILIGIGCLMFVLEL